MTLRATLVSYLIVGLACLLTISSAAQPYPSRPVRIIVGFAAGSGPDLLARAIATQLGADFGHNFVVENRPGANGTIAAKVVAQSEPDGYTLLHSSAAISSTPFMYKTPTAAGRRWRRRG